MDAEILQARLDYFYEMGYLTYHSESKEFSLLPATLLLVLKVYAMSHGLSFPRVHAKNIRGIDVPVVYTTELGERIFLKYLGTMSPELFEMIAPVYKSVGITPMNFELSNSQTYLNLLGEAGKKTKKKRKIPLRIHLLVDNSEPFEYLKTEYIFDTIYEARLFINKLVTYVPPTRLELWRVREDSRTGRIRKDPEPVLISKAPYKK